jgi:hypothetical protein
LGARTDGRGAGVGNNVFEFDALVLYQRGVGYSYDAVKIFIPAGAKKPIYAPYIEHVPPDTTAAIFWLKNRDPAHWRDAWQLEYVTGKYVISDKPIERGGVDPPTRGRGRWRGDRGHAGARRQDVIVSCGLAGASVRGDMQETINGFQMGAD